jgi:hypothetical protein
MPSTGALTLKCKNADGAFGIVHLTRHPLKSLSPARGDTRGPLSSRRISPVLAPNAFHTGHCVEHLLWHLQQARSSRFLEAAKEKLYVF